MLQQCLEQQMVIFMPVLMLAEKAADIIRGRNRLNLNMLTIINMVLMKKAGAMEDDPFYQY